MMLATGSKLGPYEVVGQLGGGGMGEVYRARDTRLDRGVAIKILRAQFSSIRCLSKRICPDWAKRRSGTNRAARRAHAFR